MPQRDYSLAVLISGGGRTLDNLIRLRRAGDLQADIRLVVSSNRQAGGIKIAKHAGVATRILDFREFSKPESLSPPLFAACRDAHVDLVVMGGFLRKLNIPRDFENRVVNIHPGLIPEFCGAGMYGNRVHRAVLEAGIMTTGCTVHFVDNQYDHGPLIARQTVSVRPGDTVDELAARVFEAECDLYPRIINAIARGNVNVVGGQVVVEHSSDL